MITNFKAAGSLALGVAAIAFALYACRKNETTGNINRDRETVVFEDGGVAENYSQADLFLGKNIRKVASISYDHSILDVLRNSEEWKRAIEKQQPDTGNIKRTWVYNTDVTLITIPVQGTGSTKEYFNVYLQKDKLLITKLSEQRNKDGLRTYQMRSAADELYYSFDLNDKDQLGNWHFEKDIPKIFTTSGGRAATLTNRAEPCAKMKFNSCMNCFITDVCGSDWMCTIACGALVPSCVAGAALACLVG